jgi:hypothetical protein
MATRLSDRIRQEIEELTQALRVIERYEGGAAKASVMRKAALALDAHSGNGHSQGESAKGAKKPKRAKGQMRPLPVIDAPASLETLQGVPLLRAIPLALKAYRKPMTTKELTALILAGGYVSEFSSPLTTVIGTLAGRRGKEMGVKKTAKGWALR